MPIGAETPGPDVEPSNHMERLLLCLSLRYALLLSFL